MLTIETVSIDASDPLEVARFWEAALGWRCEVDGDDEIAVESPDGSSTLLFLRVPDAKERKNRLHLDLRPDDQDAEVERLEALGARRVDIGQGDVSWVVLADPEDNEFCVLSSRPAS